MSFRYRLILSFITIETVFLALIVFVNFSSLQRSSEKLIHTNIETSSRLFSELVKVPLSIYDLATLDDALLRFMSLNNVEGVIVRDASGLLLSPAHSGSLLSDERQTAYANGDEITRGNSHYIVKNLPVAIEDTPVGDVTILFDVTDSVHAIESNRTKTFLLVALEILFSGLVAFILGWRIAKSLEELSGIAARLANDEAVTIPQKPKQNDEISQLYNTMYLMQQRIEERTRKLKTAHENLVTARDKAQESERLKSEFLANMSHEIRTPMNAIIGMTGLALQEELDGRPKHYVKQVHSAAEGLLGIINDILDLSKIEAGKLEFFPSRVHLKEVISRTLNLLHERAAAKGIKTRVKIERDVPRVYHADAMRLGQVLTNLVTNAVKFSHDNGMVSIGISLCETDGKTARVQFSVEDNGIGISEADREKLFQSFSQVDSSSTRKYGGTGLGLVISQKIVQMMGGRIWVESTEGVGSTFYFTVNMQMSDEHPVTESSEEHDDDLMIAMNRLQGPRVLLVEDNEMNQELAVDLLSRNGITVELAHNGEVAIKMLEKTHYDGVLMDCQMPVMDGYEATRRIREQERFKTLPILAMTANVMSGDIKRALDAGMNDTIAKPVSPDKMFKTMAQWIRPR